MTYTLTTDAPRIPRTYREEVQLPDADIDRLREVAWEGENPSVLATWTVADTDQNPSAIHLYLDGEDSGDPWCVYFWQEPRRYHMPSTEWQTRPIPLEEWGMWTAYLRGILNTPLAWKPLDDPRAAADWDEDDEDDLLGDLAGERDGL